MEGMFLLSGIGVQLWSRANLAVFLGSDGTWATAFISLCLTHKMGKTVVAVGRISPVTTHEDTARVLCYSDNPDYCFPPGRASNLGGGDAFWLTPCGISDLGIQYSANLHLGVRYLRPKGA